jgi:hypothetical protein
MCCAPPAYLFYRGVMAGRTLDAVSTDAFDAVREFNCEERERAELAQAHAEALLAFDRELGGRPFVIHDGRLVKHALPSGLTATAYVSPLDFGYRTTRGVV